MSNVEALRDIVRFLNMNDFKRDEKNFPLEDNVFPKDTETCPLTIRGNAIAVNYANMFLGTGFQTLLSRDGEALGYKALTTAAFSARVHDAIVDISKLTRNGSDRCEVIYLDRLTRTLHALNYLAKDLTGLLHLSVNPQHLLEVHTNHGEVFEQILAKCGLQPDQIVLEIAEYSVSDKRHLKVAIEGWQKRHYRIAFDGFGAEHIQLSRIIDLNPHVIKFDADFFLRSTAMPAMRERFEAILYEIHCAGIDTVLTNVDNSAIYAAAQTFPFTALQGSWLSSGAPSQKLHKNRHALFLQAPPR